MLYFDYLNDIFSNKNLYLPIRWDGKSFNETLKKLFKEYKESLKNNHISMDLYAEISSICSNLLNVVSEYLTGNPSGSYEKISELFEHKKILNSSYEESKLNIPLFRVVSVDDNVPYDRKRVFHTPYSLRSNIGTNRYSIAGHPCLYLGTSLSLCCEEIRLNPYEKYSICSRFELSDENVKFNILDLGIKPQDFIQFKNESKENNKYKADLNILDANIRYNYINKKNLFDDDYCLQYLRLYPLIAACSFIRCNKKHPFAAEYIVPQLLLQWIRNKNKKLYVENAKFLYGIRYFSCANMHSSELGFNYVFPSNGREGNGDYCSILKKCFKLTKPIYINDFENINECENSIIIDKDLTFI